MNILEYSVRTLMIVLSTVIRGTIGVIHLAFSGKGITYMHVRAWCRRVLAWSGVTLSAEGTEHIDSLKSYIFIANHASLFDIPAVQCALPGNVRIMYKKELQKIPFLGWVLRLSAFVPIVREKARDAMSTVNNTIDIIKNDDSSLIVFAEGTRTPDGTLQKFKRGAFILAIKAEKPIVPVAITGSFSVLPKSTLRFRKGHINVRIGEPIIIESREYTRQEEMDIMNVVHSKVQEMLKASTDGAVGVH